MFFHYLTLAILLLQITLHISPTHADTFSRLLCNCVDGLQAWDIHYHSNRLRTTYNFRDNSSQWHFSKFHEFCWKPPGHEFCYDRNLWSQDQVRLDSKKGTTLPKSGRTHIGTFDCTDQCRRWYGHESQCNQTSDSQRQLANGTFVPGTVISMTCLGKAWKFPDL